MIIVDSYSVAVLFCIITMLCFGSWANSSKCTTGKRQFPLFYRDYFIGLILMSVFYVLSIRSAGAEVRGLMADLVQANGRSIGYAFLGGAIFNISNLLIIAAIAVAGCKLNQLLQYEKRLMNFCIQITYSLNSFKTLILTYRR